jgi:subtilisin-like proprotein convertase family protein
MYPQNRRKIFYPLTFALFLVGLLTAVFLISRNAQAHFPEAAQGSSKVEPGLREQILADGQGTYFVQMAEKADLTLAYGIQDRSARGRYVYDTLRETAAASQADLKAYLDQQVKAGQVESYESFFIVNALLVRSGVSTLDAIAARADVAQIYAEQIIEIPEPQVVQSPEVVEWGVEKIRADEVWSTFGTTGEGIIVANIDTGVRYTHDALNDQYRGTSSGSHDFNWYDPSSICGGGVPCDNNGHGTHTMGTIAGDDGGTNEIGVAPGAQWIAAKGCESTSCSDSALLNSAEWMLAPCRVDDDPGDPDCDPDMRPHVVNNSWGSVPGGDPWYQASVDAWDASGILHVFSAGNSGPGAGTIGSPSDYCNTLSIGATDISDVIASFSSRGPGAFAGCTDKPDVSGPGVNVRSSLNSSDSAYGSASGTSMAAPHVTGCIALLLSLDPTLTQNDVYDLLTTTAVDLGAAGFDFSYGWGRIDCFEAASQLNPDFTLVATPGSQDICIPDNAVYEVAVGSISGFSDPVTLSAIDVPTGYSPGFSVNPVNPPGNSVMTLTGSGAAVAGSYDIIIQGVSLTSTHTTTVELNLFDAAPGAPDLLAPTDGATDVTTQPMFEWTAVADATSYYLEVATDAAFTNLVYTANETGTSHTVTSSLEPDRRYYWRVTASNACGDGAASSVFTFRTEATLTVCRQPALPIPDNPDVSDTMTITSTGEIQDLNVSIDAAHTWVGDLVFTLEHQDTGTSVTMIDRPGVPATTFGCSGDNIDVELDDEGVDGPVENQCSTTPPALFGNPTPNNPLSAFDTEDTSGTWILSISDQASGDTGTLNEWCVIATLPAVVYGVALSGDQALTGTAGTTVTYTLSVTNMGDAADVIDLTAISATGWTVDPIPSVSLSAGASTNVSLVVHVPANASNGQTDAVTVTAASQGEPLETDTAILTTTAEVETVYIYLPIIMKP